nr:HK97 gp10 family phage protein [Bacillus subtilis]
MARVSGRWVRQMRRATEEFRNNVIEEAKRIVTDTAELIYSNAVLNAPTAMIDGGNLKNSIEIDYRDGGLTAVISVGADYAVKRTPSSLVITG